MTEFPDGFRIEPLTPAHDRQRFSCGAEPLDRYLRQQAGQHVKRSTAAVYVLTRDSRQIDGFYTLSSLSIPVSDFPAELAKKLPKSEIPATLLGRLAVSDQFAGRRLGQRLLMDALYTAYQTRKVIASWAVIVDAKEAAIPFYLRYGFQPFIHTSHRLFLPMQDIASLLG